jgi:hypothetical protein
MSFIDLQGGSASRSRRDALAAGLRDVSRPEGTFLKAERYWPELKKLKPGEIYVSEVIGAYVGSRVIGPTCRPAPQGRHRVQAGGVGLRGHREPGRQALPRHRALGHAGGAGRQGVGYVTLALDHDHIRQFTDRSARRIALHADQRRHRRQLRLHVGSPQPGDLPPAGLLHPGYDPPPASR